MPWTAGPLENSCIYGAQLVPLALLLGGPSKILNRGPPDITLRHWFIGGVILKINIVQAEKIKTEVYVNQDKSLSDLQTLIKHSFVLYFLHELLLMSFLNGLSLIPVIHY
jgi:hypothetical protein